MHVITSLAGAALILLSPATGIAREDFNPAFEALVVVNLSAPERVETVARVRAGSIAAHTGPREHRITPWFSEMTSREVAGRSPRWFQFTLEPSVLDSIVIDWETVEILIDEEWLPPAMSSRATVIPLGRQLVAGEVVVLNLLWNPDVQVATAPDWEPRFELEELVEPPPGARLYVSEEESGIVAVHARVDGRMMRGLPTGGQPRDMVWDSLRQRLYVAVAGLDELLSIDPVGRETIRRIPLTFGADPTRVLYSADRQRIAVIAPGRDLLFLFSAASLQELGKVHVGRDPVALAEDPQSGLVYVTSRTSGQVDVVDPASLRIVSTFAGLDTPGEIVHLASGGFAVGQYRGRRVEVIDPVSGIVLSSVGICGPAEGLVYVPRVDRLFAVANFCDELTILRPEIGLEIGGFRLEVPGGLPSLGPREAEIFLPLPGASRILILPVDGAGQAREVDCGPHPWRVVVP